MIDKINTLLGYQIPAYTPQEIANAIVYANTSGFQIKKLEKDFYLTLILHFVTHHLPDLLFKGGTCLNKVYYPYFRMSEDLDFSLSTEDIFVDSNGKREKFAKTMREKIKILTETMGRKLNPDKYHHKRVLGNPKLKNLQYTYLKYLITYPSIFDQSMQTIKVELTYTTQRLRKPQKQTIQSIYKQPLTGESIFPPQQILCYDLQEMLAEKMRAGLTRKNPAIRDLFDIWYARSQGFDFEKIHDLIDEKVAEVGKIYTLHEHYETLQKQIKTDLEPVLGNILSDFDFDEVFKFVLSFKK